ncbi:hypothetical protein DM52_4877 [Burkholderia mallei]|nr:hypothetical protein DM52_4877 [Burkholderia mallei]
MLDAVLREMHDAIRDPLDRHVEEVAEHVVRIGELAGEQEQIQVLRVGGQHVARAARRARAQRVRVRDAGQQRQLHERMRQREHRAALEHRARLRAERADGQIAERRVAERRGERGPIVGRDRARVQLALQRAQHREHARERQVARDDLVRAEVQREQLELMAHRLAALDDDDLQRAAAPQAQRMDRRAQRFELRAAGKRQHRARRMRAGARGEHRVVVVDDFPIARHPRFALDHAAADDDARLVEREPRAVARRVRAGRRHGREPSVADEAQRAHLARGDRAARAPEIDPPAQLAVRALQLRDARARAVKAAARGARAIGGEERGAIVGAVLRARAAEHAVTRVECVRCIGCVGQRGRVPRIGAARGRLRRPRIDQQHERDPTRTAPAGQRPPLVRQRDRIVPTEPALRAFDEIQRVRTEAVAPQRAQAADEA